MNSNLFVYGSLMSGARHPMGEKLRGEARLVGAATLQGRLYAISWYPGAVAADDPAEHVHGEVYALDDAVRALAWLDAYEGIVPGGGQGEYERTERLVRLAAGQEIGAWAYLYRKDPSNLTHIPDGRWVPRSR